jgi:hypothetical protein
MLENQYQHNDFVPWDKIYNINKGDRAYNLLSIIENGDWSDANERIKEIWCMTEFQSNDPSTWDELIIEWFRRTDFDERLIKKIFKGKPRICYRGGNLEARSWSLSKTQAQWFADRFKNVESLKDEDHTLRERLIYPDEVAWIGSKRNSFRSQEQEVVLFEKPTDENGRRGHYDE